MRTDKDNKRFGHVFNWLMSLPGEKMVSEIKEMIGAMRDMSIADWSDASDAFGELSTLDQCIEEMIRIQKVPPEWASAWEIAVWAYEIRTRAWNIALKAAEANVVHGFKPSIDINRLGCINNDVLWLARRAGVTLDPLQFNEPCDWEIPDDVWDFPVGV